MGGRSKTGRNKIPWVGCQRRVEMTCHGWKLKYYSRQDVPWMGGQRWVVATFHGKEVKDCKKRHVIFEVQ